MLTASKMNIGLWVVFIVFVISLVFIDLWLHNKRQKELSIKESLVWTVFWILLALAFNILIYFLYEYGFVQLTPQEINESMQHPGKLAAEQFFLGYLIEKSLSIDNLFVFTLIFDYYNVSFISQQRVLIWGILSAIVMRGVMIIAGAALIAKLHWMIYVFGIFLILTALKMLLMRDQHPSVKENFILKYAKKYLPFTDKYEEDHFYVKENNKFMFTPLFLVLLQIETTDLLFAVDSIPAIFAITKDPFIVFTSNIFAILGLRALYFAIALIIKKLKYLKYSLIAILAFIGAKMILTDVYPIDTTTSLWIVASLLLLGVIPSYIR